MRRRTKRARLLQKTGHGRWHLAGGRLPVQPRYKARQHASTIANRIDWPLLPLSPCFPPQTEQLLRSYAVDCACAFRENALGSSVDPFNRESENRITMHAPLGQPELDCSSYYAQAVNGTAPEVDRRCFGEIFRRTGNLADPRAQHHRLRKDLVIEQEIFGIALERQRAEKLAA